MMTIKEAMERLSLGFAYAELKQALSQKPPDAERLRAAIIAMDKKEREVLKPISAKILECNIPPSLTPEAIEKFVQTNPLMENARRAMNRWRQEFMPLWHKVLEGLKKQEEAKRQGAQP